MQKIQFFHHRNKLHLNIYLNRIVILNCNNIAQYYSWYCVFKFYQAQAIFMVLFLYCSLSYNFIL